MPSLFLSLSFSIPPWLLSPHSQAHLVLECDGDDVLVAVVDIGAVIESDVLAPVPLLHQVWHASFEVDLEGMVWRARIEPLRLADQHNEMESCSYVVLEHAQAHKDGRDSAEESRGKPRSGRAGKRTERNKERKKGS